MAELKIQQKTSQQLVMTRQLLQSIELLPMTSLELEAFITTQVAENPLLMVDGDPDDDHTLAETSAEASDESPSAADDSLDSWEPEQGSPSRDSRSSDDGEDDPLSRAANPAPSLKDHLQSQWVLDAPEGMERMIGLYLIDALDERGYLTEPLEKAAESLGCTLMDATAVLTRLQRLDPAGVFARDLAECLMLQLAEQQLLTPVMEALLHRLEAIARGEVDAVAKACGISRDELAQHLRTIRSLNPKPGLRYNDSDASPLPPDVIIRANNKGGWDVALNPDLLPRVLINDRYIARIEESKDSGEARKFLHEKRSHAEWLIKALDQRATTTLKIATEIVSRQSMFFKYGVKYLAPLTLKTVAEAVGMHESTISRVTTGKTLHSPRGTFDLKYFFTSHVESDGEAMSSQSVKAQIQKLIQSENPDKPLSDDTITEHLQNQGIDIARRTVMKYREAMHIGSSVERRRGYKLARLGK